jgi:DNA recombination protein RmuC
MNGLGIALLALVGGVAAGVALVSLRRPTGRDEERLEARLEVQAAELRRIADGAAARDGAGEQLRVDLAGARRVLEQLRERELEHGEVVRRLSSVLAGVASKGRAGEHVLREHLSELPPSMLSCDFHVNGKTVEFALVLPDGRRLPIDSKWPALAELEALQAATEPADREACARAVERVVTLRAKEVAQYLDPALTAPVAVAAVPDAVYAVLRRAHADSFAKGVVIVPYASALPIVLFLYALVQRFGDAADAQSALAEVADALGQMEMVVENKFTRASTMLANGTDEFRSSLGKARGSIARARAAAEPANDDDDDDDDEVLTLVN